MDNSHEGLSVMMGQPIAFTEAEEKALHINALRITKLTLGKEHGWRVETVRHLNAMNRIVHNALKRAHAPASTN